MKPFQNGTCFKDGRGDGGKKLILIEKGGKHKNGRVWFPESLLVTLKAVY